MSDQFQKELETYGLHKSQLVAENEGKFVVICGDKVAGVWGTYQDALQAGYDEFQLAPFLVKKIEGIETMQYFSRDLKECRF